MLIVCAAIQAKVRRYGWKSVSKRTWLLLSLIVMMVVPLVVKAIGAHGGPSQTGVVAVDSRVWILFAVSIPGVWVAGRRGWVAETSVGTLMLFFVGVASGVVPGDQRVMLFAVPWSLAAFLVWIRPTWWTRWYVLPAVLAVALYSDLNHLQYQFNKRSDNVHAARAVFTTLTEAGAERVRFVPKHMRILFLSASFDVRHIQNRYFDQFHPDIPEGYQSTEAPRCDAGEFVVEWHRSSPTCDCLLIANEYPWRAYHCTTSDGTSEE